MCQRADYWLEYSTGRVLRHSAAGLFFAADHGGEYHRHLGAGIFNRYFVDVRIFYRAGLAAGITREACVQTLQAAIASDVPTLAAQPAKDDRVTLTGSNADYHVTLLCGAAKGTMSAYISYRWLRAPE